MVSQAAFKTKVQFSLVLFAFFLTINASAQQLAKRLILKDGSYQLITKYEVHGDRVHYFSAERSDWEDLPKSMVDWEATAKFEKDRANGEAVPEAVQLDKETAAERAAEETKSPEVAPGLRLPEDGDIFLLDSFNGEPELVELQPNSAVVDRDTKHNVLRAAIDPIASSKQTIELQGLHSNIQSHVMLPSIYVKLEPTAEDAAQQKPAQQKSDPQNRESLDRFRIVRAQSKQDRRIIGNIKVAVYGKVSQQQNFVSAKVEQLTGGWAKITPANDLTAGEYAVVEMLDKNELSSAIWDFGVNPSAPANVSVLKPEAKSSSKPVKTPAKKTELTGQPEPCPAVRRKVRSV